MTTYTLPGTSGLTMNESLLWERSQKGRCGFSLPRRDVPETDLPAELKAPALDLPDLSELDVVRHYTRLSQWNFGVDTGSYPLGSCTMKYNPKTNEVQAARAGFAQAHPLLPAQMAQGLLQLLFDLQAYLAEITGLPCVTLQPAAGAHGEYAGMRIFYAHDQSQGRQRRKVLIRTPPTEPIRPVQPCADTRPYRSNPPLKEFSPPRLWPISWMRTRPGSWSPTRTPWGCLRKTSGR